MDRCETAALLAALVFGAWPTSAQSSARLSEGYARLPLVFEPNTGQFDPQVRYASRSQGHTLFLTDREVVVAFSGKVVRMSFSGGNASPVIEASDVRSGVSNYLRCNDRSKWRTDVPHYGRVRYREIYPGVDLVFYGSGSDLEFDLAVQPGADPSAIRFALSGTDGLAVDHAGDLVTQAGGREFRLRKPTVYQETGGKRVAVQASYRVLHGTHVIQVKLAAYDRRQRLVIDPILLFSTLLGGSGQDIANAIAVDRNENAYVAGRADSTDFPISPGSFQTVQGGGNLPDAFVTKLSADGSSIVYSTFIGGSGYDEANAISVDAAGNAHIAGSTSSPNFPTTPGAFGTSPPPPNFTIGFIAELNPSGSALVFSTYFAHSASDVGETSIDSMYLDASGNHFLAGITFAPDFPVTNGVVQPTFHSGFVTKMNATGTGLIYSTFLGGSDQDRVWAITGDAAGNAYVTGAAVSADFPQLNPLVATTAMAANISQTPAVPAGAASLFSQTTFVTKLNPTATAFVYSTLIGQPAAGCFSSGVDLCGFGGGHAIALDAAGNAYITGIMSNSFPLLNPLSTTGTTYTLKLNAAGNGLIFSTAGYGPANFAGGTPLALDSSGNVWVPSTQVKGSVQLLKSDGSQVLASRQVVNPSTNAQVTNCCLFSFATDPADNLYLAGYSYGAPVVLSKPLQSTIGSSFVAKLSPTGKGVFLGVATANLPSNISFTISGTGCNAGTYPLGALLDVVSGSTCSISIPPQIGSDGKRYVFTKWFDNGSLPNPRTVTASADTTLNAIFVSQSKILGTIIPAIGGSFTTNPAPATSDGYFADNTQVNVTAVAAPGYRFVSITAGSVTYTTTNQLTITVPTTVSATFVPQGGCTYSVSLGGQAFAAVGGSGSVNITALAGCAWSASGAPNWVTLTNGSGNGNGSASYTVTANNGGDRSASLTIAEQSFTVEQEASAISGLSFIGSIPHLAGEENWTTSFTLVNKGATSATARLSFFGDDNSYSSDLNGSGSLALPFAFPQQPGAAGPMLASSFDQTVAANASLIAITAGSQTPPVQVGSAQLAATGAVDGFAIFHQIVTQQEAVVPLETRNAGSYLLAFDNTNGLALGIALANISGQAAIVHVVVRDDTGAQIATGSLPQLAAGDHFQFGLDAQFPVTASKRGTIEFDTRAGGQISVLGLRFTPPNSALTTIPTLANVGTGGGSIAHLASGDGWQTTFVLVNTGTSSAQATLSFFADATGAPLSLPLTFPEGAIGATTAPSVTQTLLPGATLLIVSSGAPNLLTGSAQLSTTGNVSGFVIFHHNGQEAVVPVESRNANGYIIAFDNTNGTATGLAVNAVSSQPVNVPVTVRDFTGAIIATDTLTLNANGHTQFTVGVDKYEAALAIRGTIEFDTPAGAQIGVLGIRIPIGAAHTYTTLPALAK